jgi:gluconokinase
MQPYIIGRDIGTGSTKAVAINYSGEVMAASQFYYSVLNGLPGHVEQDAELIWQAFANSIKEINNKLLSSPSVISLSCCFHSLMAVDRNHQPLTNLITWADTRSEKIADEIRRSSQAVNIYMATGTPIHSMSPLCKIIWLKRNTPEIFSNAFKFISIKEFIWYKLFNEYQVDYSIASGTGLFNIEKLAWNDTSLQMCSITADQLSQIVSTQYVRKDLNSLSASLLNISTGTSFCIGASDGCLANVGSYAIERGIAAITIGTSGAVRISNSSPVFNCPTMTFNYLLDDKNFICGGAVNNGGNVLKWLFKNFLNIINPAESDYNKLFKEVESVKAGADGLLFLPYLNGERAPVWDERSCGVFFGIKNHHSNAHFLRAVLEGVCYSLNNILQIIETSTSPVIQINASGGFIHSKTWMQILADVTGKRIYLIQTEDASAIGAAIFCMKAMNIIEDYSSLQPNSNVIIEPDLSNHETYKKYIPVFKNIYSSLKESMHKLHDINL